MSDPSKPSEIDEVMSSVRKLVSRKDRGENSLTDQVFVEQSVDASERLILTPSQRIDQVEPEDVPTVETEPVSDDQDITEKPRYLIDGTAAENVLVLDAEKRPEKAANEATIAQVEAAVTTPTEEWEPEETEVFDEAGWAVSGFVEGSDQTIEVEVPKDELPGVDLTETEIESSLTHDEELAAFFPKELPIDEEVLREMVIDIVREELAGEMGERITRSVRKLIRREIAQALAARDLS